MRSNKEWRSWGKTDPLWAVAAWPGREIGGATPWTPEGFLKLGASDFKDVLGHWDHFGRERGTCVEIGCGAGRITAQLAAAFDSVIALDVSPEQIKLAGQLLGSQADKVEFHIVDQPVIPAADGSCAAMFSSHVFQHFSDFGDVVRYWQETYRVLVPGGTICFHLPVLGAHRNPAVSWLRLALHNAAATVRRTLGQLGIMEYHRYSPLVVLRTLDSIGFRDAQLRIFDMASNGDAHSFFFARR